MKRKKLITSTGGYVFIGVFIMLIISIVFIEQHRKYYDKKALIEGIETIGTIIEISHIKTEFAKYSYEVNGKIYYSSSATKGHNVVPGEKYTVKYLSYKPKINTILFDRPVN